MKIILPKPAPEQLALFDSDETPVVSRFKTIKEYEAAFEETKSDIEARLLEGYAAYNFTPQSVSLKDSSSRYKVASALQKAIRRGHVHLAERYAQAIYNSEERDYLWRRMPIIAFEDVGVANLPAMALVCHACRYKTIRNNLDGVKLASYLAYLLASGNKSRALTEILVLAIETGRATNKNLTLNELTPLEYSFCTSKNAFSWYIRHGEEPHIKKITAGLKSRKDVYQDILDNINNIPVELQGDFKYSFLCGTKMSVETLNCSMPYILTLMKPEDLTDPKCLVLEMPEPVMVGGIPDYAWDYHTREGGVAYKVFHRRVKELGINIPLPALKEMMFLVDISLVDRELLFAQSQQIKLDSYRQFVARHNVFTKEFDEIVPKLESPEAKKMLLQARQGAV